MPGLSPAGPLMFEDRVIERMIAVLDGHLEVIARTGSADSRLIDAAIDFIRTYADRCHHGKEEDIRKLPRCSWLPSERADVEPGALQRSSTPARAPSSPRRDSRICSPRAG